MNIHYAPNIIQKKWRQRLLKKKMAYELLKTKNQNSLLVCERYFTGAERYERISDLLTIIGKDLSRQDRMMSDTFEICQDHESKILAYDILATRFNLNSIDELQVCELFV